MSNLCRTWVNIFVVLAGTAVVQSHHYLLVEVANSPSNGTSTIFLCSAGRSYTTEGTNTMIILSIKKLDKGVTPILCEDLYKILADTMLAIKIWTRCGMQSGQIDWFILNDVSPPTHNEENKTITLQYGSKVYDKKATDAYKKYNVEETFPVEVYTENCMATISIKSYTSKPLQVTFKRIAKRAGLRLHSMVKLNIKSDKKLQKLAKSKLTAALLFVSVAYKEYPQEVIEEDWRRANIYESYLNGVEWLTLEVDRRPAEVNIIIENNAALRDDLRNSTLTTSGFGQLNEKSNGVRVTDSSFTLLGINLLEQGMLCSSALLRFTLTICKPPIKVTLSQKEVPDTSDETEGWKIAAGSSFVWWKEFVVDHKIWGSRKIFVQYLDWSKETRWIPLNTNVLSAESNKLVLSYKSLDDLGNEEAIIP